MKPVSFFYLFVLLLQLAACKERTLFERVSTSRSGVDFNNQIPENDSINIVDLENIYNGGGVGIADFNNDGLQDLYFTGNLVPNKLYLNKDGMRFEDVTQTAGVTGEGRWSRGVSIVDINNDGLQDIYVCATVLKDSAMRQNMLYINQGMDKEGLPRFQDKAAEYGLNDASHATQAAFFDADNDGDLDLYLAVNEIIKQDHPNRYRKILINGEHPNTDRYYKNEWDAVKGHPVFVNASREAGILTEGYAHSVVVCDLNNDGWKDLFVGNDYLSEDILYINNQDGTFTNRAKQYFKHTSYNAMGADVVDLNNDGLADVIELDMNPENNQRKKTMLVAGNYQNYNNNDFYNYTYQYVRNSLHVNQGLIKEGPASRPVFAEVGLYSGIAETDWSWAPLVADFDQDGYRDMIITNGFPKDVTDMDFVAFRDVAFSMNDKNALLARIPEVKISNYAYRNLGQLQFANETKAWGMDVPSFSNGAAYGDLDNDGDLDVVVNNINDAAFLYENHQSQNKEKQHHYLQVKLAGASPNRDAYGAWVKIFYGNGRQQVYETNPVRGYLSSHQNLVHFGLGSVTEVDSLVVVWPNHQTQTIKNVKVNQVLQLHQSAATGMHDWKVKPIASLFEEVDSNLQLQFVHQQADVNDFNIQRLLPYKLSQDGPSLAVGDVNGDGLEDLVIGGSDGGSPAVALQGGNGTFGIKQIGERRTCTSFDADMALLDVDKDGDQDLYVTKGGFGDTKESGCYRDQLYLNDGKGNFSTAATVLPASAVSKSCVRATDYDQDGDMDLFVGGRVAPGQYPKPVSSYLLRNDSRDGVVRLTDVTAASAPALHQIGLVCDARWADFDGDGWMDLVLAGEWMPVTFIRNNKGRFQNITGQTGIAQKMGWWKCIQPVDIDRDGDLDFVAGNVGENSFFSNRKDKVRSYFGDFDNNGMYESILSKAIPDAYGVMKEYPVHSRDEILEQLPVLKKRFLSYKSFAQATTDALFRERDRKNTLVSTANCFTSALIRNMGNNHFEMTPLPQAAQWAPVNDIVAGDFNKDGHYDLALCGNDFGAEVFYGRMDALNGVVLKGDGRGNFTTLSLQQSGLYIPGNAKALISVKHSSGSLLVASQNRGPLKVFRLKK